MIKEFIRIEPSRKLTRSERQILQLVVNGCGYKEIGYILRIQPKTVYAHMLHSRRKLGAASTAQAVAIAVKDGLVQVPD